MLADQTIRALVNGEKRQSYAVSDVIACGTSLGARSMKHGDKVEIAIGGLAGLKNTFQLPS
jgi:hypothetical protein